MKKSMLYDVLYYITLITIIVGFAYAFYYFSRSELSVFQNNLNSNYNSIKSNLKYRINNGTSTLDDKRSLIELNFSGIPDKYDINGTKLSGQAPNIPEAIRQLKLLISDEDNADPVPDIQKLAFIYRYGAYDLEENKHEALNILKAYNDTLQDKRLNDSIAELETEIEHDPTNIEVPIDGIIDDTDRDNELDINDLITNHHIPAIFRPIADLVARYQPNIMNPYDATVEEIAEQERLLNQFRQNIRHNVHVNDSQNVHSPAVISTTKQSIDNIKNKTPSNNANFKQEIMNYLHTKQDNDKRRDAIRALNEVSTRNASVSAFDTSEVDMLGRVWAIIKDNPDSKDILFNQLASMVENNVVVCVTGRLSRIVDTLSGIDNAVRIVSETDINNEMLAKSSSLRTDFYNRYGADSDILNRGTHPNQDIIDTDLKKHITEQLRLDYVNSGIIKEQNFMNLLNGWINDI
jgi:hypothetical protein